MVIVGKDSSERDFRETRNSKDLIIIQEKLILFPSRRILLYEMTFLSINCIFHSLCQKPTGLKKISCGVKKNLSSRNEPLRVCGLKLPLNRSGIVFYPGLACLVLISHKTVHMGKSHCIKSKDFQIIKAFFEKVTLRLTGLWDM